MQAVRAPQQADGIDGEHGLLRVARRVGGQEARAAISAKERDDHPVATGRQQRHHIDIGVYVVRPAVQQQHRGSSGWPGFGIADAEHTGVHLLGDAQRCTRLHSGPRVVPFSGMRRADRHQLCAHRGGGRAGDEAAPHARRLMLDVFTHDRHPFLRAASATDPIKHPALTAGRGACRPLAGHLRRSLRRLACVARSAPAATLPSRERLVCGLRPGPGWRRCPRPAFSTTHRAWT
jgi:hypothetical protein